MGLLDDKTRGVFKPKAKQPKQKINAQWSGDRLLSDGKEIMRAPSLLDSAGLINQFMPVTGDIQSGLLAVDDVKKGDYKSAALNSLGLLPFVPSFAGTIGKKTRYELAHELAQKNAVDMLGLPANNTAMDRAKALGFDTHAYHGTTSDINNVDIYRGGSRYASPFYTTADNSASSAELASQFASTKAENGTSKIYPVMIKSKNMLDARKAEDLAKIQKYADEAYAPLTITEKGLPSWGQVNNYATNAEKDGIGSILVDERPYVNSVANLDPKQIRSRFAAFDPARANEADLLGYSTPELMGLMALGSAGGIGYAYSNKDKK